ncbi:unnamed protein product [Parascedosporium putredinis]|uniref:Thioesterase domain-containing protein n=1 Tax=Parascedosporium putredinis TaxID=1442378 RepID=A0A9P1MA18_9PEZI|nr:unnamed protein product [Parascedosporium putredinis]CAI7993121.1 unnamed protein product [Parascedosporium putredinis]
MKPESRNDLEHFRADPWCASQLSAPNIVVATPDGRIAKPGDGDALFARTLNGPDTIAAYLTFYKEPHRKGTLIPQISSFLTLRPGLNGWPGVCHGGIVVTILDEVSGQLIEVNKRNGAIPYPMLMTAYLNTNFIKPVPVPSTILVRAKVTNLEGRKCYVETVVENQQGHVLASAEGLFVAVKGKL